MWTTHPQLRKFIFLDKELLPREDANLFSEENSNPVMLYGDNHIAVNRQRAEAAHRNESSQEDMDGDDASDPIPLPPAFDLHGHRHRSGDSQGAVRSNVHVQVPGDTYRWRAATDSRCDYGARDSIEELSNFWDNWNGSFGCVDAADVSTRPSFASSDTEDLNAPSSPIEGLPRGTEDNGGDVATTSATSFFAESTRKWAKELSKSIARRLPGSRMENIHILVNNYFSNSREGSKRSRIPLKRSLSNGKGARQRRRASSLPSFPVKS